MFAALGLVTLMRIPVLIASGNDHANLQFALCMPFLYSLFLGKKSVFKTR
jgi:hypothetical protein